MKRNIYVGATFLALIAALGVGITMLQKRAAVEAATVQAPMFEVDPLWPKPLPNHWLMGMTIGVSVDAQDNIWIIHRQGSLEPGELHATTNPPTAMCCAPAPPVLEFDQDGNLLRHWGGEGKRLRLAGFEPWDYDRLQRQCVDRGQRPRSHCPACGGRRA